MGGLGWFGAGQVGPLVVTLLNLWACGRIIATHGNPLFLGGPQSVVDGGRARLGGVLPGRRRPGQAVGAPSSRRLFLAMVLKAAALGTIVWAVPRTGLLEGTLVNPWLNGWLISQPDTLENCALITSLAFSPAGRTLAVGTSDGLVQVWDVTDPTSPKIESRPPAEQIGVSCLAFRPDGQTLAVASGESTIELWDVTDPTQPTAPGEPIVAFTGVGSVAFSPDGRTLASGTIGDGVGVIQLWGVADPARPVVEGPTVELTCAVLPAGSCGRSTSRSGPTVPPGRAEGRRPVEGHDPRE